MPCYDDGNWTTRTIDKGGVTPSMLEAANNRSKALEAALCAICNELDKRGIAESALSNAGRNGLINLLQFYAQHKKEDVSRLTYDIHSRYSKDELAIIKQVIDSQL
jgi:ankyrin repeat protein